MQRQLKVRPETSILRAGAPCVRCATGKLAPSIKIPDLRRPGFSKVFLECSDCKIVLTQYQDDRFS
jgi:hypothetical protein